MPDIPPELEEQLKRVRKNYAARLPGKVELIEEAWSKLLGIGPDREGLKALRIQAHGLAGSGATYGFKEISEAAHKLEIFLQSLIETNSLPTLPEKERINNLVGELKHSLS